MPEAVFEFLRRHHSLVITTHDTADADGIGAEQVFLLLARSMGKDARIVNSSPVPETFRFMDPDNNIHVWEDVKETLPGGSALMIVDTADEYNIGELKDFIPRAAGVFVVDHHEPNSFNIFKGWVDNSASSVSEMAVELAAEAGVKPDAVCAMAAYAGIVYDTGFFAYSKTTARTFKAALALVEAGVDPNAVYRQLSENSSGKALLLQQRVFSTMQIRGGGRVAVQVLRKEDLEKSGARYEDAENFINVPMKCRDTEVSVFVKENKEGQVRCSLRSKGRVNVSKIAQAMGGGGHVAAAGFKSPAGPEETLRIVLEKITGALENI